MNPWALLLAAAAAVAFGGGRRGSRRSSVPRGTLPRGESLPEGRVLWRGSRDQFARATYDEVAAALPNETALQGDRLRSLVAAALVSLAARESGWGRYEREHNVFNVHATSGPRYRVGREVLRVYPSRRAAILEAMQVLTDHASAYRPAFDRLIADIDAGESPDVAASEWVDRLIAAGYADRPRNAVAFREESRAIAGGVLARLRRLLASFPRASTSEGPSTPSTPDAGGPDAGDASMDAGRDASMDAGRDASMEERLREIERRNQEEREQLDRIRRTMGD